mgnify:FL=1
MKKYGQAAVIEMVMNALPEIAKNVAQPLSKVDKITMYGEGNSAKLLQDIINGTTQVSEALPRAWASTSRRCSPECLEGKLPRNIRRPPLRLPLLWKRLPRNLPRMRKNLKKPNKN